MLPKIFQRDLLRVVTLLGIASMMIFGGEWFAKLVHEPAFSPWGLFCGGAFMTAGFSHVLIRTVFHKLDKQEIAKRAMDTPLGAGLVFLGICIVLASFVLMFGGMLRT